MTELEQVLSPTIIEIFGSTLALDVAPHPDAVDELGSATYAGCVHLTTEPPGTVVVECELPLARRIAARMFDATEESLGDADVRDAIGEIANMAAGNLKAALTTPAALSLPIITRGNELMLHVPPHQCVARRSFQCGADRFSIRIYEGARSAAA